MVINLLTDEAYERYLKVFGELNAISYTKEAIQKYSVSQPLSKLEQLRKALKESVDD